MRYYQDRVMLSLLWPRNLRCRYRRRGWRLARRFLRRFLERRLRAERYSS
jgi:hypothetical protein